MTGNAHGGSTATATPDAATAFSGAGGANGRTQPVAYASFQQSPRPTTAGGVPGAAQQSARHEKLSSLIKEIKFFLTGKD